jgi:hypothetical protein
MNGENMSNKLDLEVKQGETFFRLLKIKDELGAPIDLTGFTFFGQIRTSPLAALFVNFNFNILNQFDNKGMVEMTIPSAATIKKKASVKLALVYDVEMNSGSEIKRILQGSVIFDPEITK